MKREMVRLLQVLNDTVPKHEMRRQRIIKVDSEMNTECRTLFDHLKSFDSITVRPNRFGLDCIEDTEIPVFRSIAQPAYIESRYGTLVLPCRVRFI